MKPIKSLIICFCTITSVLVSAQVSASSSTGGINIGLGAGHGSVRGDFVKDTTKTMFQLGFDLENDRALLIGEGASDTDNNSDFSTLTFLAGGGYRYFKVGTGIIMQRAGIPTKTSLPGDFIVTDPTRLTQIDVSTIPLYFRVHPVLTQRFRFTLDGYYGLYTRGNMRVPVKALGAAAIMETQPQKTSGARGFGAIFLWQLGPSPQKSIRLEAREGIGEMDRHQTGFQGDIFGVYSTVTVPKIQLHNRSLILSYVMQY